MYKQSLRSATAAPSVHILSGICRCNHERHCQIALPVKLPQLLCMPIPAEECDESKLACSLRPQEFKTKQFRTKVLQSSCFCFASNITVLCGRQKMSHSHYLQPTQAHAACLSCAQRLRPQL